MQLPRRPAGDDDSGDSSGDDQGVLRTLSDGARRITELAELEGLAQPTMTILIKQLEHEGLMQRRVCLAEISDEQVDQLAAATETLAGLVTLLQRQPVR